MNRAIDLIAGAFQIVIELAALASFVAFIVVVLLALSDGALRIP